MHRHAQATSQRATIPLAAVTTRSRNTFLLITAGLFLAAALVLLSRSRPPHPPASTPLDAVPAQALVVVQARVQNLRHSPLARLLPSASDTSAGSIAANYPRGCSFDPVEHVQQIALWIPEGASDDFGLSAFSDIAAPELIRCARGSIGARGGAATLSSREGFAVVSDRTLSETAAQVAVRDNGLVLLGRAAPLARMMAVANGSAPSAAIEGDHARMRSELGGDPDILLTAVLSPTVRQQIRQAADGAPTPLVSLLAVAASLELGPNARLRILAFCEQPLACQDTGELPAGVSG